MGVGGIFRTAYYVLRITFPRIGNVPPDSSNGWKKFFNMQYAVRSTQYAVRSTQYAIHNTQYVISNTQ